METFPFGRPLSMEVGEWKLRLTSLDEYIFVLEKNKEILKKMK